MGDRCSRWFCGAGVWVLRGDLLVSLFCVLICLAAAAWF